MKKNYLLILWLAIAITSYGQEKWIQGRILDDKTQRPIPGAKIIRLDNLKDTVSDNNGYFKMKIPRKGKVNLVFTHAKYQIYKFELIPEQLKTPLLIKLYPQLHTDDKTITATYKNTLAIAPVELLFLGLTIEYERRLTPTQAIGSYVTALLNQGAWMIQQNSSGVTLTGIKLEPFYRYYLRSAQRNNDVGFAQLKLVYANFNINEHHYADPTKVTHAQGFGVGIAWGMKLRPIAIPRYCMEIVLGVKFVPFITDDESMNDLIKDYRREYWWNVIGPGAIFDIKFTIGGIF